MSVFSGFELNTATTLVLMIVAFLVVLTIVALLVAFLTKKKLRDLEESFSSRVQSIELLIENLLIQAPETNEKIERFINTEQPKIIEIEQVTKQLEHRIKMLQSECETQKNNLLSLQSQQPEDRLYSRALKLVKLGASVDEVMRECDLPQAEAEILLAIHNKSPKN